MSERGTHTLAQCHACYSSSYHHQCNFPAKPIFIPNSVILNINKPEMMMEKAFIHATVEAMNDLVMVSLTLWLSVKAFQSRKEKRDTTDVKEMQGCMQ